jgi:AraC-like DNA-binding protein
MVCLRCKIVVENELKNLGIDYIRVEIGEILLREELTEAQKTQLNFCLKPYGLELIIKRKNIIVEKVKNIIIELIHNSNEALTIRFSDYLRRKMNYDYTYLANLFSEVEGRTIESYIISKKIEKVKELILYEDLTLTEIAFKLHYSSVAHLSYQFKKVTGYTPSQFKTSKNRELSNLSHA